MGSVSILKARLYVILFGDIVRYRFSKIVII
jgi:hypothetical protein